MQHIIKQAHDLIDAIHAKPERFTYLSAGRHRMAFLDIRTDFVVKIAHNIDGIQANREEVSSFRNRNSNSLPMAKCYSWVIVEDCPIAIVMEYVEMAKDRYTLSIIHPWVWSVDCGQVGYNKQGKLVAFDYSII